MDDAIKASHASYERRLGAVELRQFFGVRVSRSYRLGKGNCIKLFADLGAPLNSKLGRKPLLSYVFYRIAFEMLFLAFCVADNGSIFALLFVPFFAHFRHFFCTTSFFGRKKKTRSQNQTYAVCSANKTKIDSV